MVKRHSPLSVGIATAETLTHRLPLFWQSVLTPSAAGNTALSKMVIEKQMAFAEGLYGMQMEMMKQALRPWWMWTPQQGQDAARDVAHAAAAPAARRVKANARRLKKRG